MLGNILTLPHVSSREDFGHFRAVLADQLILNDSLTGVGIVEFTFKPSF